MRILFISGSFLPDRCGVADYLWHLAGELAQDPDTQVAVLSACPNPATGSVPVRHFGTSEPVRAASVRSVVDEFRPDIVHIQYPSSRAVSRSVAGYVRRVLGVAVIQTWHEHFQDCNQVGWRNLLGLDGLIYVREDFPKKLPAWLRVLLGRRYVHIPNAATIPAVRLTSEQRTEIKRRIGGDRQLVSYFGFVNPNKGVEALFEIADPDRHHLLLICELDPSNDYHRRLLDLAGSETWRDKVTITGFLAPEDVGRMLAASDAVVYPFVSGTGRWNTSVTAALDSGSFVLGTCEDMGATGHDPSRNLSLVPCGDRHALREALHAGIGVRRDANTSSGWPAITQAHRKLYARYIIG